MINYARKIEGFGREERRAIGRLHMPTFNRFMTMVVENDDDFTNKVIAKDKQCCVLLTIAKEMYQSSEKVYFYKDYYYDTE